MNSIKLIKKIFIDRYTVKNKFSNFYYKKIRSIYYCEVYSYILAHQTILFILAILNIYIIIILSQEEYF